MTAAETILHSGQILTACEDRPVANALAISNGRIVAVGSDADIACLRGPSTAVISLDGRTAIPGIVDAHAHLEREGLKTLRPSLESARSVSEILEIVRRCAAAEKHGRWIVTMPVGKPPFYFDALETLAEKRLPTRFELDEAAPHHPVCIGGVFGNWGRPPSFIALNTLALERTGILSGRRPECGGVEVCVDESGQPNGWIIERNNRPTVDFDLLREIPGFDLAQRTEGLRRSIKLYHSVGTTAVYEGHGSAAETIAAYRSLAERGELTMRSFLCVSPTWSNMSEARSAMRDWLAYARGAGLGDDWLRVAGIFVGIEGDPTLARLCRAALPNTGWSGFVEWHNRLEDFREIAFLAAEFDLRLHTIVKDRLADILAIFREVDDRFGIRNKFWMIEHVGEIDAEQRRTIKALNLTMTAIPTYMIWKNGQVYRAKIKQMENFLPLRDLVDDGVSVGVGTDNIPYNPFFSMWVMRMRQERMTGDILAPSQRVSAMTALHLMTRDGARVARAEQSLGSIEVGKWADLAVLSDDPLTCDIDSLKSIRSLLTMTSGRICYRDEQAWLP